VIYALATILGGLVGAITAFVFGPYAVPMLGVVIAVLAVKRRRNKT
jgi:hypothetical protein